MKYYKYASETAKKKLSVITLLILIVRRWKGRQEEETVRGDWIALLGDAENKSPENC